MRLPQRTVLPSSLKHWSFVFIVLWFAIVVYVATRYSSPIACATDYGALVESACKDPLHYASKCDLRLYFLSKLQERRKELYTEHGLTTSKPLNILFYSRYYMYDRSTDRWWFLRYNAALRNPYVKAVLWGPEFPHYADEETLGQNIERVYGSATYFHVIVAAVWTKKYLPELVDLSNDTVILEMHDESWCISGADCADRLSYISLINASVVGFAYPSEMLKAEWQELSLRRHMFHIPKTVSAEIFYRPPDPTAKEPSSLEEVVAEYEKERDIDVLLISAVHYRIYPIRWKLTCMYKSGYFDQLPYKFHHQIHPGYKTRTPEEPFNLTMSLDQIEYYASLMRRSKIVVTDSSRYHYAVGKYAEIPASGALILGDIPDEREDDFNFFVARINYQMKPDELVSVIKYWLENPIKRYQRAKLGQAITLQKYTNDHSIDLIVLAYLRFKQGQFGTHFAYQFQDSCKATSPVHMSQYCLPDSDDFNTLLTPDTGWHLPPRNCTITLNEKT